MLLISVISFRNAKPAPVYIVYFVMFHGGWLNKRKWHKSMEHIFGFAFYDDIEGEQVYAAPERVLFYEIEEGT